MDAKTVVSGRTPFTKTGDLLDWKANGLPSGYRNYLFKAGEEVFYNPGPGKIARGKILMPFDVVPASATEMHTSHQWVVQLADDDIRSSTVGGLRQLWRAEMFYGFQLIPVSKDDPTRDEDNVSRAEARNWFNSTAGAFSPVLSIQDITQIVSTRYSHVAAQIQEAIIRDALARSQSQEFCRDPLIYMTAWNRARGQSEELRLPADASYRCLCVWLAQVGVAIEPE